MINYLPEYNRPYGQQYDSIVRWARTIVKKWHDTVHLLKRLKTSDLQFALPHLRRLVNDISVRSKIVGVSPGVLCIMQQHMLKVVP